MTTDVLATIQLPSSVQNGNNNCEQLSLSLSSPVSAASLSLIWCNLASLCSSDSDALASFLTCGTACLCSTIWAVCLTLPHSLLQLSLFDSDKETFRSLVELILRTKKVNSTSLSVKYKGQKQQIFLNTFIYKEHMAVLYRASVRNFTKFTHAAPGMYTCSSSMYTIYSATRVMDVP